MGKKRTDDNSEPVINDLELSIIHCQIMRLPEKEALIWLQVHGHEIDRSTYYNHVKTIREKTDQEAMEIAKRGLMETHMKMIHTLEVCERNLWQNYHELAGKPTQRANILKLIIEMQPFLTQAYDKTRVVMEKQAEMQTRAMVTTAHKK